MSDVVPRAFYEAEYHFDEDVERPNLSRLWRALRELQPLEGTDFLDLGCGVGWATQLAIGHAGVARGVGLDFAIRPLQLAMRHTPAAAWVNADGTMLPFRDEAFDRVFSFGSVEHFPDISRGFREISRVLRPGGMAAIVVPNFYVHTDQPLELRATAGTWQSLIESAGLEVVRVGTDAGPAILKNRRPLRILMRLGLRILSLFPALRYQFVFVLRKSGPMVEPLLRTQDERRRQDLERDQP